MRRFLIAIRGVRRIPLLRLAVCCGHLAGEGFFVDSEEDLDQLSEALVMLQEEISCFNFIVVNSQKERQQALVLLILPFCLCNLQIAVPFPTTYFIINLLVATLFLKGLLQRRLEVRDL